MRRFLAACLWVVRALTAVVVVGIILGVAVALLQQPTHSGTAARAEVSRPSIAEPVPPPAPFEPAGTTRFVRRLEAGEVLRQLRQDVEQRGEGQARFAERYKQVKPFLLVADGRPGKDDGPERILRFLTEPPRDLETLVLARANAPDRLGSPLRVRAWTLGDPYPANELECVSATMGQIVRRAGRDVEGGIDVLITPGMGRDVFPGQRRRDAVGVYFPDDRYCVTQAGLRPEYRHEVVEHECIHALWRSLPSPPSSRFVSEGLAEYLRFVEAGDASLDVPPQRLADSFAELASILTALSQAGIRVDEISPSRLVDLAPRDFYALGPLGYLIAQVSMAYVGGEVIERAFAEGSDRLIVEAVRRMTWADLVGFSERNGGGGQIGRVRIVEDVVPEGDESWPRDAAAFAEALIAIGAEMQEGREPPDPATVRTAPPPQLETETAVAGVLALLLESTWTPRVYVDLSRSMDRPVSLAPTPADVAKLLGGSPGGDTPRRFALRFLELFDGAARRSPNVVALGPERLRGGPEVLEWTGQFDLRPLVDAPPTVVWEEGERPRRMITAPTHQAMVMAVIVGSPGTRGAGATLASVGDGSSGIVLVIDLSADGEGSAIARAYDAPNRSVAYWRPVR